MEFVQVYPDVVVKVFPGEPLEFFVTLRGNGNPKVEIWTDIVCEEYGPPASEDKVEFAVPLSLHSESGTTKTYSGRITPLKTGFYSFSSRYRSGDKWVWDGGDERYETRTVHQAHVEPSWVADTIVYNAFVRQFGAADRDGDGIILPGEGGTFADLINRMDHLAEMKIGAVYLNPIQKSTSVHVYDEEIGRWYRDETNTLPVHLHPGSVYSIEEYKSIDPELGLNTEEPETDQYHEFKRFVDECHGRGIRVILDVVFDHTAIDSFIQRLHPEWFMYKEDPANLDSPFVYYGTPEAKKYWGRPEHAVRPYDHGIFWTDCAQLNWELIYQPAPNDPPKNPRLKEMKSYFKSVLKYWIKNYGVDGFRLDVSYAIPTEFWHEAVEDCRRFAHDVCQRFVQNPQKQTQAPLSPDILFIGETYVDKVYELQACGLSLINGDFSSKLYNVESLKGYLDYAYNISGRFFPVGSRWLQYPECHDWHRLPGKFKEHLHHEDSDVALNKSRWTLACLLPGTPLLHNGYEVVEHQPLSVRSYSPINWDSEKNISKYIAKVNRIRLENVAFQRGTYTFVNSEQGTGSNAQLFSFLRQYRDELFLVVVNMDFNNAADHVQIYLPEQVRESFVLEDLMTGIRHPREGRELTIVLGPGESHVFRITV